MAVEDGAYRALVQAQILHISSENDTKNGSDQNCGTETSQHESDDEELLNGVSLPHTDKTLVDPGNEIVIKDVHFHYPTRPAIDIFRGGEYVSFDI